MKKNLFTFILSLSLISVYAQKSVLLNENFENGQIPSNWSIVENNQNETWQVEYQETHVLVMNNDWMEEPQDEWFISPSLDFSENKTYSLTFNFAMSYVWGVDPFDNYDCFVKISIDGGESWSTIWTEDDFGYFESWEMQLVSIDLSSFSGNPNVKIAFQYYGADGASVMFDNIVVRKTDSKPVCANLIYPGNQIQDKGFNALTLRWEANENDADYYSVYLDQKENPTNVVGVTTNTELSVFALAPSSTYYWKVVPHNFNGTAENCEVFSFSTSNNDYCYAQSINKLYGKINHVQFADIDNYSTSVVGYEDFTHITGNVEAGKYYNFTVNTEYSVSANKIMVWIDTNHDKTFGTEELVLDVSKKSDSWSGQILIPSDALNGSTRMRIRLIDTDPDPANPVNETPCAITGYGEVEDYTINILNEVGISNLTNNYVKLYPNPINDVLFIDCEKTIQNIQLTDMSGKIRVAKKVSQISGNKHQIDLSKLLPGAYILKITMSDNTIHNSSILKK